MQIFTWSINPRHVFICATQISTVFVHRCPCSNTHAHFSVTAISKYSFYLSLFFIQLIGKEQETVVSVGKWQSTTENWFHNGVTRCHLYSYQLIHKMSLFPHFIKFWSIHHACLNEWIRYYVSYPNIDVSHMPWCEIHYASMPAHDRKNITGIAEPYLAIQFQFQNNISYLNRTSNNFPEVG